MQLHRIKEISGTIVLRSGLHIGSGDMEMKIGGTDSPVIKHPHTQEPYIPGSSIKGKVRSLLEMRSGLMVHTKGEPIKLEHLKKESKIPDNERSACEGILKLFGGGADESMQAEAEQIGPTRVAFADCALDPGWLATAEAQHLPLVEVKSENAINRIKGVAQHPRFTERVPADARFRFLVTLKVMDVDTDGELEDLLLKGLRLLEMDALGGSGSRGYGRLRFEFDENDDADLKTKIGKFKEIDPFN
jgi:CRISPR-associated protein Csm3